MLTASTIFVFFFIPETKNRTFDEIAKDLELGTVSRSASMHSRSLFFRDSMREPATPSEPATPCNEDIEINHVLNNLNNANHNTHT